MKRLKEVKGVKGVKVASRSAGARASAALAALAFVVGCSVESPIVPTDPSAPGIQSIEIVGPDTIAPGQSAQFAVRVRLSDGALKTALAADVQWGFHALVLRVDAAGLATSQGAVGDTTLLAHMDQGRYNASKVITIVPEGTFRVTGRVTDAEAPSVPISGALVEVVPGSIAATTNLAGEYKLFAVPPAATIRVTKAGFHLVERSIQLTAHATQDFALPPDGPRPVLSGPYTLAIDLGGGCNDISIPANVRNRRYDAVITQNGSTVDVTLVEAGRFVVNSIGRGNRFTGDVYSGGATFELIGFDFDNPVGPLAHPNVAERLSDGTVLSPAGAVVTVGGAAGLTGQMGGGSFISRFGNTFPNPSSFMGGCNYLSPILFSLTPR